MIPMSNLQNKINSKSLPSIPGCLTICFFFPSIDNFWKAFHLTLESLFTLFLSHSPRGRQEIRLALPLKYCVSSIPPSPLTLLWSELYHCSPRLLQVPWLYSHCIIIIFNQGAPDRQVSKSGRHFILRGDRSPVLDIMRVVSHFNPYNLYSLFSIQQPKWSCKNLHQTIPFLCSNACICSLIHSE